MDKQTFSEQVLAMGDSLYRVARTILRSPADCEDAVQEAVAKAWEKRGTLREERYFRTWLTRIVINECYALCRRQEDTVPLYSCTDLRAPTGEPVDTVLRDALMALPVKLRVAMVLYYVEGYSVGEIAGMTRVPAGTVKSRLSRGRKLLREALSETDQGGTVWIS